MTFRDEALFRVSETGLEIATDTVANAIKTLNFATKIRV